MSSAPSDRRAGDPRVMNSRRAIRRAALAELAEAGYGGFALESVAARAGVGRSTVYRHWSSKLVLIADALETLNEQPAVHPAAHPATGTAREQVEVLLRHLAEALVTSPFARCIPALVHAAEQDATVREFHHGYSARRRQTLVRVIAAGVTAGEFPATVDPELASLTLSGAIFYRRLMTGDPVGPAEVPALIDSVLGRSVSRPEQP